MGIVPRILLIIRNGTSIILILFILGGYGIGFYPTESIVVIRNTWREDARIGLKGIREPRYCISWFSFNLGFLIFNDVNINYYLFDLLFIV